MKQEETYFKMWMKGNQYEYDNIPIPELLSDYRKSIVGSIIDDVELMKEEAQSKHDYAMIKKIKEEGGVELDILTLVLERLDEEL